MFYYLNEMFLFIYYYSLFAIGDYSLYYVSNKMNDVFFDIEDDALPPPLLIMSFNSFLEYFSVTKIFLNGSLLMLSYFH